MLTAPISSWFWAFKHLLLLFQVNYGVKKKILYPFIVIGTDTNTEQVLSLLQ